MSKYKINYKEVIKFKIIIYKNLQIIIDGVCLKMFFDLYNFLKILKLSKYRMNKI